MNLERSEMKQQQMAEYKVMGKSLVICLPFEVDDHSCQNMKEETENYIKNHSINRIIFDFSKTGFMDSAGIGVLLGRYRRMKEIGGEIVLFGEDPRIRRILKLSGIYQIIRSI